MIDLKKPLQTRDGRPVRVYASEDTLGGCIHGAVQEKDGKWGSMAWPSTGGAGPGALENARTKETVWVCVGNAGIPYIVQDEPPKQLRGQLYYCEPITIEVPNERD